MQGVKTTNESPKRRLLRFARNNMHKFRGLGGKRILYLLRSSHKEKQDLSLGKSREIISPARVSGTPVCSAGSRIARAMFMSSVHGDPRASAVLYRISARVGCMGADRCGLRLDGFVMISDSAAGPIAGRE